MSLFLRLYTKGSIAGNQMIGRSSHFPYLQTLPRPGERISSGSARRRAWERKAAMAVQTDGLRMAEEKKQQSIKDCEIQKKIELEEISAAEPWGRPGCGAPNPATVRRKNLKLYQLYPDDEIKRTARASRSKSPIHRPRRVSRIRTKEDKPTKNEPQAETIQVLDNQLKHQMPPDEKIAYKKQLDEIIETKKEIIRKEIVKEKEWDRKWRLVQEPWGKAGPGGVPWRDPRGIGRNFFESMGWTDNKLINNLKYGIERRKRSVTLPPISIKSYQTIDRSQTVGTQDMTKGNQVQQISSDSKNINYNNDLTEDKQEILEPIASKIQADELLMQDNGGVELMPLIARRRTYGPKPLPSSDVTRPQNNVLKWKEMETVDYLQDLIQQMNIKRRKEEEQKKLSADDFQRHCDTWAKVWGRPGHGAPNPGQLHRTNLGRILHVPLGVH